MKVKKLKNALLIGALLLASSASQAQNWLLNGNSGTNPSTDFLGTIDPNDLVFRTMNIERMRLTQTGFLGIGTITPNYHLDVNGDINLASAYALKIGGVDFIKTIGFANVLLGSSTSSITFGTGNTFVGWGTGNSTTTGSLNNFIGGASGGSNVAGSNNNFIGYNAGALNTNGNNNNYLGNYSGYLTEGNNNNFIGYFAGGNASGGFENTFIGTNSGYSNTTGFNNIYNGEYSGYSNTTGDNNNFSGFRAGFLNTTGYHNLFLGYNSGSTNTTGTNNIFTGDNGGVNFSTGVANVAIGWNAGGAYGGASGSGGHNTLVGSFAGDNITDGYYNVAIGTQSGASLINGYNNIAIGQLSRVDDGNDNIVIGTYANSTGGLSNSSAFGKLALVSTDNTMALGGTGDYAIDVLIGYSATSGYQLDVNGTTRNLSGTWVTSDSRFKKNVTTLNGALGSIMKLNPVKYQYKDNIVTINEKGDTTKFNFSKGDQIGFLAQELEQVIPELVNTDNNGYKAVNYAQMVSVLVQGIKEQQVQIEKQNLKIEELTKQIAGSNNNNGNNTSSNKLDQSSLSQNTPNPFSETTIIKYHLNNGAQSSSILIFDLNGTLLKTYNLNVDNKDGEIQINSGELKPGMFIYSLVVNSNEVDTKKMILSK